MFLRLFALPVALIAFLAIATPAAAAPGALYPGGVRIGVAIGSDHRATGYWSIQTVPTTVAVQVPYQVVVWVPDRVIGLDANGNPIWAYKTEMRIQYRIQYVTQYVTQRVWVQTGYIGHHRYPRVYIGLGFGSR